MRLFVGNLTSDVSQDDLEDAFTPYGTVTLCTIVATGGVHRGFGFVEMPKQAEAEAAIAGLNGRALKPMGKAIVVADAARRPRG